MCGILGTFAFDGSGADFRAIEAQVASLAHRGPDDETCWTSGAFAFGHRRLSIIALAEGRQPMASPDGRLVVTFNGEIYNYVELREELAARGYGFRTPSDTEVLLHGYDAWGRELPARLVGMFAFAIADRACGELFLARDRFGEKPLLYSDGAGHVAFASEMAPLSAMATRRDLNRVALTKYLCLNYVPGDDTLLQGVKRIPPGTWRLYRGDGRVETGRYWSPPREPLTPAPTLRQAVDEVESRLHQATALALRSDVPVGIFLSGGIDSALIARFAAEIGHLSQAFCLTFDEATYSEWDRASETAHHLGIPLTRVRLSSDALSHFFEIVRHGDDPHADSSAVAVWTLAREAARHVKVVLSGDGGDELFGGYLTYKATAWHRALTARLPMPVRRGLARGALRLPTDETKVSASYKAMRYLRALELPPGEAHFSWNGVWMPQEAAALLADPDDARAALDVFRDLAARHRVPAYPSLGDLQRADVSEYLPNDILAKADGMSMAHGLEVRAPFLNPALADYALRLPAALKLGPTGPTKRVLRELARVRYGKGIALAGKQGFSIPVHTWLRGAGRDLVADLLSDQAIARIGALDPARVRGAVDAHMSGRRSLGFELWGLMVLSAWHRRHIAQVSTPVRRDARPVQVVLAEGAW